MHFKSLESVVIIFTKQDAAHSVALLLLNDYVNTVRVD